MNEPLGETLFWIALSIFCLVFVVGWAMLLVVMLLQWLFPNLADNLERFLSIISKPLGTIQKYSIYGAIVLFVFRLIVGWLGWAEPLSLTAASDRTVL